MRKRYVFGDKERAEREYKKLLKKREKWISSEREISKLESELRNASTEELERIVDVGPRGSGKRIKLVLNDFLGLYKKDCDYMCAAYRILKQKGKYDKRNISYELLGLHESIREVKIQRIERHLYIYEGPFDQEKV